LKHAIYKIVFDPLDFLEYFCPPELNIAKKMFGHNGLQTMLQKYTMCPEYAKSISTKHEIRYRSLDPVSEKDLNAFVMAVATPTTVGSNYLATRGIGLELARKYEIGFFSLDRFRNYDFGTLSPFYLFNFEELEYCQYQLKQNGLEVELEKAEYLVCVSRDKTGKINNLGFRVLEPVLESKVAKWIFSHGRQATFGLHDIEDRAIVVEGFFDSLALWECGYPAVGLGSVAVSPFHWEFLKNLQLSFLLDNDETGRNSSMDLKAKGHKILKLNSTAKDPFDAWQLNKNLQFEEL
jgi:DNA primase